MLTVLLDHKLFLCNIVTVTLKKSYIELRTRNFFHRVRACAGARIYGSLFTKKCYRDT